VFLGCGVPWERDFRLLFLGRAVSAGTRSCSAIGQHLAGVELPLAEVHPPRALVDKAVAAWEREDEEGPLAPEDFEQRTCV
jgi:hypothetical protein